MNDFKYHYLFTSFDLETFEMEDFRYNFVNITAFRFDLFILIHWFSVIYLLRFCKNFRLVDTNDVFVKETLKEMEQFSKLKNIKFKKNLAVEVKVFNHFILLQITTKFPFSLIYYFLICVKNISAMM